MKSYDQLNILIYNCYFAINNDVRFGIFSLPCVQQHNTLFVHVLLFRYAKCLIYLPALLETVYVQMPEIDNIIFIKLPGAKLCKPKCFYENKFKGKIILNTSKSVCI